jgi:hypothetical protein
VLVNWVNKHKLWHVSISVCIGVAFTILIAGLGLWKYQMEFWRVCAMLTACFMASGTPMVAGSTRATVKESHQRRPLPNSAMRIRDDVVMELSASVNKVVDDGMDKAMLVHTMHQCIGKLKSM